MPRQRIYPNELLTKVMHVRLSTEQHAAVKKRATAAQTDSSGWIRGLIEKALREDEQ